MKLKNIMSKQNYCTVRPEIVESGLCVPIGDYHYCSAEKLRYRWLDSDTIFQVFYKNEWLEAYSIDFNF